MKFTDYNLSKELKANLEKMGFKRPTDIQFKCIPHVLKNEDLLAVAQTGTGKTAAFGIPLINKIQTIKSRTKTPGIRAIVMVPTRELALQITEVFHSLARNTKIRSTCIYGGVDQNPQIDMLLKGVDILITTPGRMFDLASQGYLNLNKIETLVLDEADQMLQLGFYKDIEDLIRYLPKRRQTLFFSATIDDEIKKLAYSLVTNAIRIQISPKDPVSKNVKHAVVNVEMDDKRFFLERIVKENEGLKILVFVRTKVRAERVKAAMKRVAIVTDTIHGDKEQEAREAVLKQFRTSELRILIATDISARGIDIPNVDFVINYDLPDKAENYTHRVGRTGRGKNKGQALTFCSSGEKEMLKEIETYNTVPIQKIKVDQSEVQETILFTDDGSHDWKALIERDMEMKSRMRNKKNKRK